MRVAPKTGRRTMRHVTSVAYGLAVALFADVSVAGIYSVDPSVAATGASDTTHSATERHFAQSNYSTGRTGTTNPYKVGPNSGGIRVPTLTIPSGKSSSGSNTRIVSPTKGPGVTTGPAGTTNKYKVAPSTGPGVTSGPTGTTNKYKVSPTTGRTGTPTLRTKSQSPPLNIPTIKPPAGKQPYIPPKPSNASQAKQATQGQGGGAGRKTNPPPPGPGPGPGPQPFPNPQPLKPPQNPPQNPVVQKKEEVPNDGQWIQLEPCGWGFVPKGTCGGGQYSGPKAPAANAPASTGGSSPSIGVGRTLSIPGGSSSGAGASSSSAKSSTPTTESSSYPGTSGASSSPSKTGSKTGYPPSEIKVIQSPTPSPSAPATTSTTTTSGSSPTSTGAGSTTGSPTEIKVIQSPAPTTATSGSSTKSATGSSSGASTKSATGSGSGSSAPPTTTTKSEGAAPSSTSPSTTDAAADGKTAAESGTAAAASDGKSETGDGQTEAGAADSSATAPSTVDSASGEHAYPGSSSSHSAHDEAEAARRRAEREAHERAKHEAAQQGRKGAKERAKGKLGYDDVEPSQDGHSAPAMVDHGAITSMISNLGAILASQPAVNVTQADGLCGDGFTALCEKAAKKAAKELEKELKKARAKARREAKKRNRERKKQLRKERRKAQKEARKRARERKRSRNKAKRARLEEELRKKGPKLGKDGKELSERGKKLADEQKDLNEEERRLREAEGDARKNDPNCRGQACQDARAARAKNARAIAENAKNMGRFQADMARHTGQMQDFQRKANQLNRMNDAGLGMTRAEFRSHMADKRLAKANADVNTIKDRLRALVEKRDEIGRRGGSGSRQWKEVQREMDALNKALPKAEAFAEGRAAQDAIKAKALAMGLGKEYRAYEKAQRGSQALKDREALGKKLNRQSKAIQDAKAAGASSKELRKMQELEKQLQRDLKKANADVDKFARDAARDVKGKSTLITKQLEAKFKGDQTQFVRAFNEKRALQNMTDRELVERDAIFKAAEKRIDQATNGIGKDIPRAKGGAFKRRDALKDQKLDAQDKLAALDKSMNDAFQRGPVFEETGRAYQKARNEILEEIEGLDREISKFAPLDYAEAVVAEAENITRHLNGLTDGLPKDAKGRIDAGKLAEQVVVVGRTQMEMSRIAGEMKGLQDKAASGKKLSAREQSRLEELKSTAGKMSAELKKAGLDVKIKDGKLDVAADNLAGSVTWNASREAITENIDQINKTKRRLAQLRRQQEPKDLLPKPPATTTGAQAVAEGAATVGRSLAAAGAQASGNAGSGAAKKPLGKTRARGSSSPDTKPAPKVNYRPGGLFGDMIAKVNKVAQQAAGAVAQAAENALWSQKKAASAEKLAALRRKAEETERKAREDRKRALKKRAEAERAARERDEAGERLQEKRDTLEGYGKNRVRQAKEYKDIADNNSKQAERFREKAEEQEAKGDKLRAQADKLDAYADRMEATDKRLAAKAREAATNAREDAKAYDQRASGYRQDEASERGYAQRFIDRGNKILDEARGLFNDYNQAVDTYKEKVAFTNEKITEFKDLAAQLQTSSKEANASAREFALTQNWNFNHLMENRPSGTFYSGMSQDKRIQWLKDNVPNWNNLSQKQKENFLDRIVMAEADQQYDDAAKAFKEFTAKKDMSEKAIKARLDVRAAKLKEAQAIKDQWTSSDADRKKIAQLEGEADLILRGVRSDQKKHAALGKNFLKKRQELARVTWAQNEEKRNEEVLRRVDWVAQAKGELQLAEHAAQARRKAFADRLAKLTDAKERARLIEVEKGFKTQDQARINTLRHTYRDRLSQISLDSSFDNLHAIGTEERLGKAVDARLKQSGVVAGRLEGQTKLAKDLAKAVDVTPEKFNGWRALVDAYDKVAVGTATAVGTGLGVLKGGGKALLGLGKLVIWEPIDTLGERGEQLMGEILPGGFRTNVFGTDNQEFADKLVLDPGGTAWNMLMGMGKQSFDAWQNLKKLKVAAEAGEAGHAFDASLGASTFLAENLLDPTMVLGGLGRGLKGLSYLGKFDDAARALAKGIDGVDGAAAAAKAADDLNIDQLGAGFSRLDKVIGRENLMALGRVTARGEDLLGAAGSRLGDFGSGASRRLLGDAAVDALSAGAGRALEIGKLNVTDAARLAGNRLTGALRGGGNVSPVPGAIPNVVPGGVRNTPAAANVPKIAGSGNVAPGAPVRLTNPANLATPNRVQNAPGGLTGNPGRMAALTPPGGRVPSNVGNRAPLSRAVNDGTPPLLYTPPKGAAATATRGGAPDLNAAGTTRLPPPDLPPAGTVKLPPPDLPPAGVAGTGTLRNNAGTPPPARGPPSAGSSSPKAGSTPVAGGSFGANPAGPATPGGFGASPAGPGGFGMSPGGPGGFGMSPGGPGGVARPPGFNSGGSTGGAANLKTPIPAPAGMKSVDIVTAQGPLDAGIVRLTPPGSKQPIVLRNSDFLGEGSSSKAYAIPGTAKGDDLGRAFKFNRRGDGSFKLDDGGREVIKGIEKTNPALVQTPTLHKRFQIRKHERLNDPVKGEKEFAGGFVSEMDRTPPTVNKMQRAKPGDPNPPVTALGPDGRLSSNQVQAFHRGTDAITSSGHAWVDNHNGNFSFNTSNAPGANGAVLVVTDPGGIIPMKATRGPDGQVRTPAQNARDLQNAIHNPPAHIRDKYRGEGGILGQVEHQKWLAKHFDDAVDWDALSKMAGSDIRSLGRPGVPEDKLLSFNPRVSIDHPELFAFTPPPGAAKAPSVKPTGAATPPTGTTRMAPNEVIPLPGARKPATPPPTPTVRMAPGEVIPLPGSRAAAGKPVAGKTGVQRQQHCENCALVMIESMLKDAGIILSERSQALMRKFAIKRNLMTPGKGMDIHQAEAFLHMNGVNPKHMRKAARTPEEMGLALQRGEDLGVIIQNGKDGYHWVRVEGFTRDASGTPWVSLGEGSLPAGMSKRMTVKEFDRLTRAYPETLGGPPGPRLQSITVNPKGMTAAERSAARVTAAANVDLAKALDRSGPHGTQRLTKIDLPGPNGTQRFPAIETPNTVAAGSPGGAGRFTPDSLEAVDSAFRVPTVKSSSTPAKVVKTDDGGLKVTFGDDVALNLPKSTSLGSGQTSLVREIPEGISSKVPGKPGQVARLTSEGNAALDDLGRGAVELVDNPAVIQTPKLHGRFNIAETSPHARKFENGTVSVVDKVSNPPFHKLPADMKGPNGAMTPGQVEAFTNGLAALNKKGYAWLDNKHDNFTFKRVGDNPADDKWVLVVIDPGGMVPMVAKGGRTAAQNAAALQKALANPGAGPRRLGNTGGGHSLHKADLAEQFDSAVDWARLQETTGKNYQTLGSAREGTAAAAQGVDGFPYRPRSGFDHPEVTAALNKPPSQPSAGSTPVAGSVGKSAPVNVTPSAVAAKTAIEAPPVNAATLPKTAIEAPVAPPSLPKTAIEAPPGLAAPKSLPKTALESPPGSAVAAKTPKPVKEPAPPAGKIKVTREDGSEVTLDFGTELGSGSTSTAYRNRAAEDKLALRVTRAPDTANKSPSTIAQQRDIAARAEKLDDFGRSELGFMADKDGVIHLPDGTTMRTPRVLERIKLDGKGTGPLKGAAVVEVVELAPASFNKVVAKTGKGMTRGQAIAFDKAHRFLNENGLVWLDNHAGNFGFKHLGGDNWEFWIIDPGGIVPVTAKGGKSASTVARDLQKIINDPPKKLVDRYLSAGSKKERMKIARSMMAKIVIKHGDSIDVGRIGLSGPDKLIFNPSGVLPFRRAHELFTHDLGKMDSIYRTFAKAEGSVAAKEVAAGSAASKTLPWAPPPTATAPWAPGNPPP